MKVKTCLAVIAMIAISSIFNGCAKDSAENKNEISLLTKETIQATKAGTIKGIQQSYDLLSNIEKQQLWDVKWNTVLKNDAARLTTEQGKIVTMIRDFVDAKTVDALMKDPTDGEAFIKTNLPYFEQHFTKAELYLLIECSFFCEDFSIFKSLDYLTSIDERFQSTYNPDYAAANKCTCYYSIYCSMGGGGGGTCDTKVGCERVAKCGLTGSSNCTGTCK